MSWDYTSERPKKYVLTYVRTYAKQTPIATFLLQRLHLPLLLMHQASQQEGMLSAVDQR